MGTELPLPHQPCKRPCPRTCLLGPPGDARRLGNHLPGHRDSSQIKNHDNSFKTGAVRPCRASVLLPLRAPQPFSPSRGGQCVSQTPLVTRPMSFLPETVPVDTWWLTDVGAKGGKPDVSLFLQETPKERRCFLWVLWYLETQKSSWSWKRARLRAELTCQQYRKDRGRAGVARPLLSHPWGCCS